METRIPEDTPFDTHFLGETSLEEQYPLFYTPISWSAIFAGLVTALATSICLSFLVAALGLSQMDFSSSSPFEGSFLSVGIGSLIVMLISLASGSFVAGRFAETSGALHGFLTWALLTLLMALQASFLVSSAASLSAKIVSESGATQKIVDSLKTDVFPLLSKLNGKNVESFLRENTENGVDFDKLRSELRTLLKKSEISALDPDRLKQAYQKALKDVGSVLTAFKNDPSHSRTYLRELRHRLSDHIQTMTAKFNQSEIIDDLMKGGMTRAEAQKAANHALDVYQTAEAKIGQTIKAFEQQANTLSEKLNTAKNNARHGADKTAKTASHMGWWGFLGSLIGAILSSVLGYYGYRSRKNSFTL
ncbi:TIGR04086 family membrane protein [Bartonella quintana]|uniref:DUF3792 domain-containing protein n=1 Tax=Bartonella quintana (strain Toulouse) TaxID=283165 RepID=A0A0G2Q8G8_BARQU|nr:TIGR04086 family membrane protein [Bartonella quintana]QUG71634.1 DUF3792 domain-containing protein [Bartonella quintana]QUG72535.1 DUF3792 domain-containing protein [Bartonella quintana]CAF26467.1 hypothetical protein BQ09930 [Bartonella quintana str. Toulouse]CAF26552.1 hypothetical protein BQ10850 [Bartonella quintana str. Toulouse]